MTQEALRSRVDAHLTTHHGCRVSGALSGLECSTGGYPTDRPGSGGYLGPPGGVPGTPVPPLALTSGRGVRYYLLVVLVGGRLYALAHGVRQKVAHLGVAAGAAVWGVDVVEGTRHTTHTLLKVWLRNTHPKTKCSLLPNTVCQGV